MGGVRRAYVDVLYDVYLPEVLAKRADADAVAAVADQILHHDIGAVRLEGNTVVSIVDVRVLDDDVGASVSVPSITYASASAHHKLLTQTKRTHRYSSQYLHFYSHPRS